MQYSKLLITSLAAVSLLLSGCGADTSLGSSGGGSSNTGNNNSGNNSGDNSSGESGGNGNTGGNSGNNSGGNTDAGNNGGNNNGNTGGGTTEPAELCALPDSIAVSNLNNTALGNSTGNVAAYNSDNFTAVSGTNLEGTWVITAQGTQQTTETAARSYQKLFLLIKNTGNNTYDVANCSARVISQDVTEYRWANQDDKPVAKCIQSSGGGFIPNPDAKKKISWGTNKKYLAWTGYINHTLANGEITLSIPSVNDPNIATGIKFTVNGSEFNQMTSTTASASYNAKKISNSTISLGKSSFKTNITKDNAVTTYDHAEQDVTCFTQKLIISNQCNTNSEPVLSSAVGLTAATTSYHHTLAYASSTPNIMVGVSKYVEPGAAFDDSPDGDPASISCAPTVVTGGKTSGWIPIPTIDSSKITTTSGNHSESLLLNEQTPIISDEGQSFKTDLKFDIGVAAP